ncbi:MAG TPA: acetylxylan esterase [Planctomycetota bacterium]|nr:acetylxylan esterase [Planctomycetota bacterium]
MMTRLALLVLCFVTGTADTTVQVAADLDSGIYEPGKPVTWSIQVRTGADPGAGKVSYVVRPGGAGESAKGELDLVDGKAQVRASRDNPGTLLLEVKYRPAGAEKDVLGRGGAAFAPDQIAPSAPVPDDFDAFWKEKIAELAAVPYETVLTPVDVGNPSVEYFKITMNNIRGSKIHGQIAKPAGKTDLPALLQVQWAGVYPLQKDWVLGHAKNGWLSMNILAHDLPIDESAEFYKAKSEKDLNDYPGQGNDDREQSYFLKMFLSCYRAVDYLTGRPDWNKKALVVHGGSQGGYQSIVTAGMHPAVTALAANVPAGCDHTGKQANRAPGWPNWASRTWQGKDAAKMLSTSRYFDAMNFATKIHCPALVGLGLVDPVCPPEGVLATVNLMKGPKKIIIMPKADHGGDHKAYYAVYGGFLEEQKAGPPK